jgi:hypothetical protein
MGFVKKKGYALWFLIPIVLFAVAGAFAKIMSGFDHNEHMYIAASMFVAQGKDLYQDFAYLQMPYLPLLYGSLYRLMGVNSYYYFIGKLISFIFLNASALILFVLSRRVGKDSSVSLSIVALFLLNMSIVKPATEVSNYIMPVAFSYAGFYVFYISFIASRIRCAGVLLAGILVAFAIGAKLTYATIVLPFVAIILIYPLVSGNSTTTVKQDIFYPLLSFISGVVIGCLPMLLFMSDIQAFVFNNLGYHGINTQWRQITGFAARMSLDSKLTYAREVFFDADNQILLLGILLGFGFIITYSATIKQAIKHISTGAILAFLLVVVAVPTALAPTPTFPQYFAVPISFSFLLLAFSGVSNSQEILTLRRMLFFILVLMSVGYNRSHLLNDIIRLAQRSEWSALRVHDVSMNIRSALIANNVVADRKIATLSPLFAIESNLTIYSELATGPFLYRVGDLLTPDQRDHFVGTSPNSVGDLLSEDAPAAILVGFEGDLDKPLTAYAIANNYKRVPVAGLRGTLYARP